MTTTAMYRRDKSIAILKHLANGLTLKEAAHETGVHHRTCEKYIEYMRKQYKAKSTNQLIYLATKKEVI